MTTSKKPGGGTPTARQLIADAHRIVIKVGSSLFLDQSERGPRREWLTKLATDIAKLRADGKQIAIVSSGAVALGRRRLKLKRSTRLDQKQAAAAAGQILLMDIWQSALDSHDIPVAQLLLTIGDTERRRRWLNARATMEVLLASGALPVINENDTVATERLRYGDNDRLSARAAQMIHCDLLILLSDVDGIYTADPNKDPDARHLSYIPEITREIEGYAGGETAGGVGSGGMHTKVEAARIASAAGCATIITSGWEDYPIQRLIEGGTASIFAAHGSPASVYKQWIAGTLDTAGTVLVDRGAARALASGKSLLPSGVADVLGDFERGSCLAIVGPSGAEIAKGISAYNAAEARAIAGHSTREIQDVLGYRGPNELIHRDDLVTLGI